MKQARARLLRVALVPAVIVAVSLVHAGSAHAATWCGTPATSDRTPQASAGYSVHLVYAVPADGADQLAAKWGSAMQTDAETIDAWWRREDPTRTVRFDTFAFPCGTQLDITFVRLPGAGATLDRIGSRFQLIYNALLATSLLTPYEKTVLYYDGPDNQGRPTVCGQGGGLVAFVYVNACDGVPNDGTVAHELLHALGAVPAGAPHDCPPPDSAHTCDTETDIMYPYANGANLFALLLDPGRDDYYGHSGSWWDVQDSQFLARLDAQTPLSVTVQGSGRVVSDIPGVDCTAACASQWNTGTAVALTATPTNGQRLIRWSGGCSGAVETCTVSLAQTTAVTALFAPSTFGLRVSVSGKGAVRGAGGLVSCPAQCRASVSSYTPARLVATPAAGWRFKAWSGACRGSRPTCTVPMKQASSARATFVRK